MRPRCVVVGGGVVGAMTALRLAERGSPVTLVDASVPGSGTSATTFAHVNASYAGYWDYFELRAAGVAGYRRLRAELGSAPWLVDAGFLQIEESASKQEELADHVGRLREAGYSVAGLTAQRVRRDLEPDLAIGAEVEEVFFYPDEGYLEVHPMLAHLLRAGTALGLVVRQHQKVAGFDVVGDQVRGVTLASGERITADTVVCCCGRWTDSVLALAGSDAPLMAPAASALGRTAPGLIVVSSPLAGGVRRVVCVNGLNLRPDGAGRLMLWSGDLDARLQAVGPWDSADGSPTLPPELPQEALELGGRHVPALQDASIENAHVCVRAVPRDGLPVAGWVPWLEGLYVIAAHAAVTLAPALGELAAGEIVDLREDTRLARFRPDRFSATHRSPAVSPLP
jgi:glycine/D-amino acid oxidase-like deaminating enzyme